jgi:hypothetical protein
MGSETRVAGVRCLLRITFHVLMCTSQKINSLTPLQSKGQRLSIHSREG